MALFYADASALVKLVRDEPQSGPLRAFLSDADLVSCELVLTEVPRAIRRAVSHDPRLPLETLIGRAAEMLDAVALLALDRGLLAAAGSLAEPALRALDAIHVAAAVDLSPLDAFVSYDERQAATARLAGLRTVRPEGLNRDGCGTADSSGAVRCYTRHIPTSHPRHSITETPAVAAALEPLRARLGANAPTLAELVMRGAEAKLRELEAQDRAQAHALQTFVDRLCAGPEPDFEEIGRIRHASRHP